MAQVSVPAAGMMDMPLEAGCAAVATPPAPQSIQDHIDRTDQLMLLISQDADWLAYYKMLTGLHRHMLSAMVVLAWCKAAQQRCPVQAAPLQAT